MADARLDVLVFVEDPGAANMIIGLDEALRSHGLAARIVAPERLHRYLEAHGQLCAAANAVENLLDLERPRVLLVGTSEDPQSAGLALVAWGRCRGIPTAAVVDGPANAEHRFRGRSTAPLAHAPDRLAVPDERTARAYARLGFPSDAIAVCGHPLHDRVLEAREALDHQGRGRVRKRVFPGLTEDRVLVLFLAELSDGLDPTQFVRGPEYTLAGRGGSDRRTDIVLEEVLDALRPLRDRIRLALRLHPKNTPAEFAPYGPELDAVSAAGTAWDAVYASDLVVGMTTVLLFEAALLGRPVLSMLPRSREKTWLAAIDEETIRSVSTRSALRTLLPAAVADPAILASPSAAGLMKPGARERLAAWIAGMVEG
jgi:hypothetical protein